MPLALVLGMTVVVRDTATASSGIVPLVVDENRSASLTVDHGKSSLIEPGFSVKRVSVGNPEIADVVVINPRQINVVAKSIGETNVVIWDRKDRPQAILEVLVDRPRTRLEQVIAHHLPGESIAVDAAGGAVVLSGSVSSTQVMENALQLASSFGEGKIVNLLEVRGQHQVMIEVLIAEMSRTMSRRIGTNFTALIGDATDNVQFSSFLNQLTSIAGDDILLSDRITLAGSVLNNGDGSGQLFMDLLESEGLTKVLAEPTLVARSGETASFLAGGEIPIPVAQGGAFGSVTVEFKDFGIAVEFTPTVLSEDRIHLRIAPEVSEPDFAQGAVIEGFLVPAFQTRRASTGVDLADSESFAIAGLLSDNVVENVARFPILGEIPVLGALFRSSQFRRDETELVLIVTPRLVAPLGAKPSPLPTDHFHEPSRFEFYLLGELEQRPPRRRATPSDETQAGLMGPSGYRFTPTGSTGGAQ